MDDSRIVRDLLEANLALTAQVVDMANRLASIGAPVVTVPQGAPIEVVGTSPAEEFKFTGEGDWQDIPDNIYDFPPQPDRAVDETLPMHMSEEEEDLRFSVSMGQAEPDALADMLRKLQAPSIDIQIDPS